MQDSLDTYRVGQFDFALNVDAVATITGLNASASDALVSSLRRSGSKMSVIILTDIYSNSYDALSSWQCKCYHTSYYAYCTG